MISTNAELSLFNAQEQQFFSEFLDSLLVDANEMPHGGDYMGFDKIELEWNEAAQPLELDLESVARKSTESKVASTIPEESKKKYYENLNPKLVEPMLYKAIVPLNNVQSSIPISNVPIPVSTPMNTPINTPIESPEMNKLKRRSLSSTSLSDEQKRKNHILSEKKRRNGIKTSFETLNNLLPPFTNVKAKSKTNILFDTISYIRYLQEKREYLQSKLRESKSNEGNEGNEGM